MKHQIFALLLLGLVPLSSQAQEEEVAVTHDGLVLVEDTDVHAAFIDPDADLHGDDGCCEAVAGALRFHDRGHRRAGN